MKVKRSLLGMLTLGMILCGCFDTPIEEHVSDATTTTPPDPDAHYAYTQEKLFVERGENQIYGILYLPQDVQGPLPAVIYAHGYGGTHQNGTAYAQVLAEKGYAVYCFDFCGGSPDSQSDGSTLDMSIFTEQEDLMAVIDAIGSREDIDPSPLYLLGSSQGGVVSAITAARQSDRIAGMILLYPAFILCEEANSLFADAAAIPDSYYFLWMEVGRAYFEVLIGYDVYEDIGDYTKDVWILHGDADTIVPPPLQSVHRTATIMQGSSYCPAAGMAFMATPSRKRSTPSWVICGTAITDRKSAHTEHTPTGEGHPLWTSNHKKTERKTRSFPRSVFCFVFYARSSAFTSLRRASSTFS